MDIPGLPLLKMQHVPRSWVILGIVVLAVPFVLFLLSMKGCACATLPADSAPATRTGPDTIRIVMHPDTSVHHERSPTLALFVNGRDAGNRSQILHAGLPLVISPPEGLAFQEGSAVTLQGRAVAGNESMPINIVIVVSYTDTGEMWVIGDQNI
jgi:hypothetical protein